MSGGDAAALRVVALISGRGSNLQALIEESARSSCPYRIVCVISNVPDAPGLDRARAANIAAEVIDHRDYPSREGFDGALREAIDAHEPGLVVLAGFMRILGAAFVERYSGRMLNIHPSLLPRFRGLDTHARAVAAGVSEHGASVHFVTSELDGGPVVLQARVPVLSADDASSLAARVLAQEHRIYPLAVRWFAEGRLASSGGRVLLDGLPLTAPPVVGHLEEPLP